MQPIHPRDQLQLAHQRGTELRNHAATQRLAKELRVDRRTSQPTLTAPRPFWRWHSVGITVGATVCLTLAVALGLGALSIETDIAPAGDSVEATD